MIKYLVFVGFALFSSPCKVLAEPLRVGVILPLSGYVAEYGESIKNAITLLQSELDQTRADQIQFIYEDSEYDGKKAISAFHKITKTEQVDLLYVWGTTPAVVLAPLAESAAIPMIAFSGDSEVAGGKRYVLDSVNRLEDCSLSTLTYIRSKGYKNIGIVKTEIQYLESLVKGMEENLNEDETIHLIDSFTPDVSADVKTSALKVRSGVSKGTYDIIGVFLITGQISSFYQRLAQLNIDIPSFGSEFFSDHVEMKKAGPAAVGAFFIQPFTPEEFSEKFLSRYQSPHLISYAFRAYSLFKTLYDLFPRGSENLSAEEIISRIEEKSPEKSSGNPSFFIKDDPKKYRNPGRRFQSEMIIRTIKVDGSH
jgi:ABC-type branched-subunit amino acid transport system substrate-binding protein